MIRLNPAKAAMKRATYSCESMFSFLDKRLTIRSVDKASIDTVKHQLRQSVLDNRWLSGTNLKQDTVSYSESPYVQFLDDFTVEGIAKGLDKLNAFINDYRKFTQEQMVLTNEFKDEVIRMANNDKEGYTWEDILKRNTVLPMIHKSIKAFVAMNDGLEINRYIKVHVDYQHDQASGKLFFSVNLLLDEDVKNTEVRVDKEGLQKLARWLVDEGEPYLFSDAYGFYGVFEPLKAYQFATREQLVDKVENTEVLDNFNDVVISTTFVDRKSGESILDIGIPDFKHSVLKIFNLVLP